MTVSFIGGENFTQNHNLPLATDKYLKLYKSTPRNEGRGIKLTIICGERH